MAGNHLIVIGSGVAGLTVALSVTDRPVTVVTPGRFGRDGSTWWAKGGIAAAIGEQDSSALHAKDTLIAGAHRGLPGAVEVLCEAGADAIAWLQAHGTRFDHDDSGLRTGKEGAHSVERIVHAGGDQTGEAIARALTRAVLAGETRILEGWELVRIESGQQRVSGVHLRNADGLIRFVPAQDVVLATGGTGALFPVTTNPEMALGTGLGCAIEAGAKTADLALVQFHPTALAAGQNGVQADLLTEALRGAGAHLVDEAGRRFMKRFHDQAELAPRDVVARAIWQQAGPVYLDARRAVGERFPKAFPAAFRACMDAGIDPRTELMPVKPAAHYHMGGVAVDLDGRSSLAGLWACGECACTGVHGANRLASNSLLEGVVFGQRIGKALQQDVLTCGPKPTATTPSFAQDRTWSGWALQQIRGLMWDGMGLVRTGVSLRQTLAKLEAMMQVARHRDRTTFLAANAAVAMTRDALQRRESVGAHYRTDYPVFEKTA